MSQRMILRSVAIVVLGVAGNLIWAQSTIEPQDRLRGDITESDMVTVPGSVHPALQRAVGEAPVDATFPMEHMILLLRPDASQQAALDQLVAGQHDPQSSQFHKFLTPEQYAARFGVSQNDIDKITGWLTQHGFQVEEVTSNRLSIIFSGDALAVQNAFKTEVKQYSVNGEVHHANSSDPQIPAALAGVVRGVVKLHDFHTHSFLGSLQGSSGSQPLYTAGSSTHSLAPIDWAQIYDARPLYANNLNGNGQSIAVVARSNVKLTDIQSFRSEFALPASPPTVILAQGTDPGFTNNSDSAEATLDVEWAGAVAPQAQVKLVVSSSTATTDGVALAASYAVNHNVAPVLSVSFGACEAQMGASSGSITGTEIAFYNSLWQQAASQGMSVFVAAGDSGAAGCDSPSATAGSARAVNGICSSPYVTCVGGTEFNEGANPGQYWLPGNNAALGSAQSYIPEIVWNQSASNGGSALSAAGGGASIQWTKPTWQIGPGVPADGARDVPDVAVSAASHDAYLIFYNGALTAASGTSAAAPSFASLFTIINQKYNSTQGNANPVLYPLAIKQSQGGAVVFHDITSGNNSVPGVAGYGAGVGYDLASGLGSVDALQLVNHWHDVSLNGTFALTATPAAVSVQAGQNVTVAASVTVSNGYNWPVSLSVKGVPAGITATFSQSNFSAPGAGTSSLQLASNLTATAGTYALTITASGEGFTQTATVTLTVTAIVPKCALTATPATVSLPIGQATNVRLTCLTPQGNVPSSLALSVSGQPTGVTAAISPATLVPATGMSSLTITAASTAAAGSTTLAVTASAGTFSETINVPLILATTPSLSVTPAVTSLTAVQAVGTLLVVNVADIGTFSSATSLSLTGMPAGMTGSFSPSSFAAPGAGTSTLTITPSVSTPPGKYTIYVVASGGGLVKSTPVVVTVTAAPNFTFTVSQSALTIQAGQTGGSMSVAVSNPTNSFNSAVTFAVAGLPTGVSAAFTSATLAAPGTGTSTLTLTALSTATPGQYKATISATGGTVTQTVNLLLTVLGIPGFTLQTNVTSLSLTAGAAFSTTVSILPQNSFNAPVSLTLAGLPGGVTGSLSTNSLPNAAGTATLSIQTTSTLVNGTYTISLSGASAAIATALPSQTATIQLNIGSVQTTLSLASLQVPRGGSASLTITDTATNFTGSVSFAVTGLPPGVSYGLSPNAVTGSGSSTLSFAASVSSVPGTYGVTVRTAAGGNVFLTPLSITLY